MFKDPDARLDYRWDWSAWLTDGDTITSHTLTSEGVTVESSSHDDTSVTAWVSGGTQAGSVTCRITTEAGRIDDRTMTFQIQQR